MLSSLPFDQKQSHACAKQEDDRSISFPIDEGIEQQHRADAIKHSKICSHQDCRCNNGQSKGDQQIVHGKDVIGKYAKQHDQDESQVHWQKICYMLLDSML